MKKLLLSIGCFCVATIMNAQMVSTFAGSGALGSIDATGIAASFQNPTGVCIDASGNLFVADQHNHKIRKISSSGEVTTFAGNGFAGLNDGTGTNAKFVFPADICMNSSGDFYVADYGSHRIRKITAAGVVTTFAGSGDQGSVNATGIAASFNYPIAVCVDPSGNVYVADYGNYKIRKITPAGVVTTFAGSGTNGSTDANGITASFNHPFGVCSDALGTIYVTDTSNNKIRKITPNADVTTFAGSGLVGSTDAVGTAASFNGPFGINCDSSGNLFVSDNLNHKIRKISPTAEVTTIAGSGTSGSLDALGALATFYHPTGLCTDMSGNIYIADEFNNKIRKITTSLAITQNQLSQNLKIYPNPTSRNFNIEVNEDLLGAKVTVYNTIGQKIKDFTIAVLSINQNLNKGIYLLEIEKSGIKISKKLIVN